MACKCDSLKAEVMSQRELMAEWFQTLMSEIRDAKTELVELIKANTNVGEQPKTTGQQSSIVEPIPASAFLESNNNPLHYGDPVCDSNPVLLSPEPTGNPEMEQPPDPTFENELILEKIEPRRAEELSVEFSITQNECSDDTFEEQTRATSELNQFCSVESANINAAVKNKQVPVNKEERFSLKDSQKSVCQQPKNKRRMYRCSECPYEAVLLSNVKKHALIHSEEKPFACDQCDFNAHSKYELKVHQRVHTGGKPFACNQCDFRTRRSTRLKDHQRRHTGEKPFACDQCDFRTIQKVNLENHQRMHTGEKPFQCDLCEYRAASRPVIYSHRKRKHQGQAKL